MSTTPLARPHSPPTPPNVDSAERAWKRHRVNEPPVASTSRLPYDKGLHLAPMVRIGTLPVRLLSLEYGAELVWGPEIVDKAIIGCTREVDHVSGVIRYKKQGRSIWETHPTEKPRLIFQLGSADAKLAVQAAQIIQQDVAGVGLNCGCPKPFSIQGGMGAALLSEPDKLCSILKALTTEIPLPIDAKIRLSPDPAETLSLVKRLVTETGISNLTVHCRTRDMRSSEKAMHDRLRDVVELGREAGVPVVANGDCFGVEDKQKIEDLTGVTSIMIARGAEANPSCFAETGLRDPVTEVIPRLVRIAIASDNPYGNTKYILNSIQLAPVSPNVPSRPRDVRTALKLRMTQSKTYAAMSEAVGLCEQGKGDKFVSEVEAGRVGWVEEMLPEWTKRRREIVAPEDVKVDQDQA